MTILLCSPSVPLQRMNGRITSPSSNPSTSRIVGWYSAGTNARQVYAQNAPGLLRPERLTYKSSLDPAREAYDEAIKLFNAKLTGDDCKRIWLRDQTCMADVQKAVLGAKKAYDARSKQSTARKWLSKLSSRVTHYGAIMDVLAQHHPEYTSLAWGAMKFLFVVSIDRLGL